MPASVTITTIMFMIPMVILIVSMTSMMIHDESGGDDTDDSPYHFRNTHEMIIHVTDGDVYGIVSNI